MDIVSENGFRHTLKNLKKYHVTAYLILMALIFSQASIAATSYISQGYVVELLDDLPEQSAGHRIRDINLSGQIVGEAQGDTGVTVEQAVRWSTDASITNIEGNQQEFYSSAYGINDVGVIVGQFDEQAAMWVNGNMSFIRTALDNRIFGYATDINNLSNIWLCY